MDVGEVPPGLPRFVLVLAERVRVLEEECERLTRAAEAGVCACVDCGAAVREECSL